MIGSSIQQRLTVLDGIRLRSANIAVSSVPSPRRFYHLECRLLRKTPAHPTVTGPALHCAMFKIEK